MVIKANGLEGVAICIVIILNGLTIAICCACPMVIKINDLSSLCGLLRLGVVATSFVPEGPQTTGFKEFVLVLLTKHLGGLFGWPRLR